MSICLHILRASSISSFSSGPKQAPCFAGSLSFNCSLTPLSPQIAIVAPITSCPACFNKSAATEESTPPDIPTKTFI